MNKTLAPFVSIIMPIRNEADFIERSLGAVLNQNYPHERMEILIADGMSSDTTREIISRLCATSDIKIMILDNPKRIVSTGLNIALSEAVGEIIVRIDGHTIIASDYVQQCVKRLQAEVADNVGGRMNAVGTTPFGEVVAIATSTPFGVGGARFHYSTDEEYVDTVYMGAWKKQIFERIGLFDEELVRNQDDEFNYRLRATGGRILLSPDIKSTYFARSSLSSLWRQYYQYGFYKVRVMQKHAHQMRLRQFAPATFVGAAFIGTTLGLVDKRCQIASTLLIAVYVSANIVASIMTARRHGLHHLRYLPFVFAVLHLSYGLGFWHGLIKFRTHWKTNLW